MFIFLKDSVIGGSLDSNEVRKHHCSNTFLKVSQLLDSYSCSYMKKLGHDSMIGLPPNGMSGSCLMMHGKQCV